MRVKRAVGVDQFLGKLERLARREDEVVRDPFIAGRAAWQRPAQRVTWPGIASPPCRITITPARARVLLARAHRSGSGSASQVRRAESNLSGCSSGRKCPAPSMMRHR